MIVRIGKIQKASYVDGPGKRDVIFFQGCSIHCSDKCQNKHLWKFDAGTLFEVDELVQQIQAKAVTISGGEPFDQLYALIEVVNKLAESGIKDILIYSGYSYEQLNTYSNFGHVLQEIADQANIVCDPYDPSKDDDFLVWRGSHNQRAINLAESFRQDEIVYLDWNSEINMTISEEGNVIAPLGMASILSDVGTIEQSRMCGQTLDRGE